MSPVPAREPPRGEVLRRMRHPLARTCTKCGAELSPTAKFCPECAQPTGLLVPSTAPARYGAPESYTPKHLAEKILTSRSALEGERKQVTVLFCDIADSSRLAERLDPEAMHQLMDRALRLMAEAVHRYEGTVNQFLGDGLMALFGAPRSRGRDQADADTALPERTASTRPPGRTIKPSSFLVNSSLPESRTLRRGNSSRFPVW